MTQRYTISLLHVQGYLPTKRHRKMRRRTTLSKASFEVPVLSEDQFPVAFIVTEPKSVYEGAKTYKDFEHSDPDSFEFKAYPEELRTYDGKLFEPVRITHGAAISTEFEDPLPFIPHAVESSVNCYMLLSHEKDFTEESKLLYDNLPSQLEAMRKEASQYVIFDGKVYMECGEPMYVVNTFGLGHNHGGTSLFVTKDYNPNICKDNYFNALHREEALEYARKKALGRGDTNSVETLGMFDDIKVLMPEMVHRDPQSEHGGGNPFMNGLEAATQQAGSVMEAGLLAILYTDHEIRKNRE